MMQKSDPPDTFCPIIQNFSMCPWKGNTHPLCPLKWNTDPPDGLRNYAASDRWLPMPLLSVYNYTWLHWSNWLPFAVNIERQIKLSSLPACMVWSPRHMEPVSSCNTQSQFYQYEIERCNFRGKIYGINWAVHSLPSVIYMMLISALATFFFLQC